jgi:hypothetical protein|tara:strand:- start:134 stop:511 length:378 start_codon:yes stop_codon:yes gene_type:complete
MFGFKKNKQVKELNDFLGKILYLLANKDNEFALEAIQGIEDATDLANKLFIGAHPYDEIAAAVFNFANVIGTNDTNTPDPRSLGAQIIGIKFKALSLNTSKSLELASEASRIVGSVLESKNNYEK